MFRPIHKTHFFFSPSHSRQFHLAGLHQQRAKREEARREERQNEPAIKGGCVRRRQTTHRNRQTGMHGDGKKPAERKPEVGTYDDIHVPGIPDGCGPAARGRAQNREHSAPPNVGHTLTAQITAGDRENRLCPILSKARPNIRSPSN